MEQAQNERRGKVIVIATFVALAWMVMFAVYLNHSQAIPANMLTPKSVATNGL